jgi:hypothetical protein
MKRGNLVLSCILVAFLAAPAVAEEFSFEVGLSTDSSRLDFTGIAIDAQGVPIVPQITTEGYADNDNIALSGTWYFNGLSDASGPRARAAFLNRASSVSLLYSRGDGESDAVTNPPPPFVVLSRLDTKTDSVLASLRYVSRQSGWFGTASIGYLSTEASFGMGSGSDTDATFYGAGFGKYVGASTAVEVNVGRSDNDFNDATTYGVALTHLQTLGEQWQYALDVAYSQSDNSFDEGRFLLRPSLYPSKDVEFGLELTHQQFDGGRDVTGIGGFASWFVRRNVVLSARYGTVDEDESNRIDTDIYSFGIGIDVRF